MSRMVKEKRLTCFFYSEGRIVPHTIIVDDNEPNSIANKISDLVRDKKNKFYNLACISDGKELTYNAEYLKTLEDFRSRKHLLNMETLIKKLDDSEPVAPGLQKRWAIRNLPESEWIERHGSGTLRKNKRIGFTYRTQYLAERIAYEFGYGFQIVPRAQITFGDPISEENCHAITEAGWHIERYISLNIFDDYVEAKYIHASYRDNSKKEGIGIIVRETSSLWIPSGHIIFSIIAEFDPYRKVWKDAINPF